MTDLSWTARPSVQSAQRYTPQHPCPICGGWNTQPRGKGMRCWGYVLEGGTAAVCMQVTSAREAGDGYMHFLDDECPCATPHTTPAGPRRERANGSAGGKWVEQGRWSMRDYTTGKTVAEHVRYLLPDGRKTYTWRRNGSTGLKGMPEASLPLYGGYEWLQRPFAERQDIVYVEGENACSAALALGLPAVGIPLGAPKVPNLAVFEPFLGARQYMWPDHDEAGELLLNNLGALLSGAQVGLEVLRWPAAPDKGDAVDFLAAGGTREQALELVNNAQPWHPSRPSEPSDSLSRSYGSDGAGTGFGKRLGEATTTLKVLGERYSSEVEWLAEGYLALGELVMVPGPPESFKSWLMADLVRAVHVADGLWLGSLPVKHGKAIYFEMERARNLVYQTQRLATGWSQNMDEVLAVAPCGLDLCDADCQAAVTALLELEQPVLAVFNSYKAIFRGRPADSADVAGALQWLGTVAERLNMAVAIVDGDNKLGALGQARGMAAHADSIQKEYEADAILHVERKRDEVGRGTGPASVYVGKRRQGESGPAFQFDVQRIDDTRARAIWLDETTIERNPPPRPSGRDRVLAALPKTRDGKSRQDVASETRLAASTVSGLLHALQADGLAEQAEPHGNWRRPGPSEPYEPSDSDDADDGDDVDAQARSSRSSTSSRIGVSGDEDLDAPNGVASSPSSPRYPRSGVPPVGDVDSGDELPW